MRGLLSFYKMFKKTSSKALISERYIYRMKNWHKMPF